MTGKDRKELIPGPSSRWELFYYDTFDVERPSFLAENGVGAIGGLYALWSGVVENGIMDDGRATFSSYELRFGESALERVAIHVDPFENVALVKIRRWVESSRVEDDGRAGIGRLYGLASNLAARMFKYSAKEAVNRGGAYLNPILRRTAAIHLLLLEKSDRWAADLVDVAGEARRLLHWVHSMTGPEQLHSDIERTLADI